MPTTMSPMPRQESSHWRRRRSSGAWGSRWAKASAAQRSRLRSSSTAQGYDAAEGGVNARRRESRACGTELLRCGQPERPHALPAKVPRSIVRGLLGRFDEQGALLMPDPQALLVEQKHLTVRKLRLVLHG